MKIDLPVAVRLRLCRSLDEFHVASHDLQAAHSSSALDIDLDWVTHDPLRCIHCPVLELWTPRCLARSARRKHLEQTLPPVKLLAVPVAAFVSQQVFECVEAVVLVVPLADNLPERVHECRVVRLQHSLLASALMLVKRHFHELLYLLVLHVKTSLV